MNFGGLRRFPLFWTGRAASQFGDEITVLALPWLVAESTASPLAVGTLQACSFLPMMLFGLPLGVLADRQSRRWSMIYSDLIRVILLGSLPFVVALGFDTALAHVLVVAFVAGACRVLFEASSHAFLADLVPAREIGRSNARLSFTEGVAIVAGPSLGGLLIVVLGAAGAITADAVTFLVSAIAVSLILPVRERREEGRGKVGTAVRAGLRFIRRHDQIKPLAIALTFANLGSGIVGGLVVLFFQRTLRLEGWEAGLAYACNGVGAIIASILSGRVSARLGFGRTVIAGLISSCVGFALLASATHSTWVFTAGGGMAVIGVGVYLSIIASASLRQHLVPGELLGRVTASYRIFLSGALGIGALVGGIIGELASVRVALFVTFGIYVVVVVSALFTALNAPDPAELALAA